jgi:amidase
LIAIPPLLLAAWGNAQAFEPMRTHEATIADIHDAIMARDTTCRQLVRTYIDRIEAFDRKGPALNAIVIVNPDALARADEIDAQFAQSGFVGPLHCVPMIIKDNYDIAGLPTSAGSLSLKNSMAPRDAFQVRRLREAGAVILAKSNMAEFARSPFETVNSLVPGHTRNPYALDRVPAGSSGGTAAAIAANFGAVGLGTDTGNSLRGPSSHTSLVGIRSTMGLTSRAGIVPLFLDRDIGGPMARTVADAVAVFDVIAGTDPADPVTQSADSRLPASYLTALDRDGLKGARIGVLRQLVADRDADPDVVRLFERALIDMMRHGAEVVDGIVVPEIEQIPLSRLGCDRFKADIDAYLRSLGPLAPMKSLDDILASQRFHPSIQKNLLDSQAEPPPDRNPRCGDAAQNRGQLADGVFKAMDDARLDVLIHPTWNNPPRLIGDLNSPHGNNSNRISPQIGFPSMTVPMGFVRGTLPAGLQFLGRPWSEETLFKIAYGYEQATRHRRAPASTPPIP